MSSFKIQYPPFLLTNNVRFFIFGCPTIIKKKIVPQRKILVHKALILKIYIWEIKAYVNLSDQMTNDNRSSTSNGNIQICLPSGTGLYGTPFGLVPLLLLLHCHFPLHHHPYRPFPHIQRFEFLHRHLYHRELLFRLLISLASLENPYVNFDFELYSETRTIQEGNE